MSEIALHRLRAAVGTECPYCGSVMTKSGRHPSRDCIVPRSRGGTHRAENVIIVCAPCNNDRGNWSLPAFLAALQAEGDPRAEHVAKVIAGGELPP